MSGNDEVRLLGQQVRVKLDDKVVLIEGKFLSFSDGGEFVIQDESGFLHYCWPMLEVVAVTPDKSPDAEWLEAHHERTHSG